MDKKIIEINNLNFHYPTFINKSLRSKLLQRKKLDYNFIHSLKNINLKFEEGERVGLVGLNGSGKSTLLKLLADIHYPTSGNIYKKYKPISILDFQAGINKFGSGYDNIYILGYLLGFSKKQIIQNIDKIIEFTELNDFIDLPVSTYSAGMLARITTSIALSTETKILLMDEYFGTLDSYFREKVFRAFSKKLTNVDLFILATHDISLVNKICNRVIKLEDGKVIDDYNNDKFDYKE